MDTELDDAARHRQQMQEERNRQNPPKRDEIWICEFCEYEAIFGRKPRALIRQYEVKDRRIRQEEADRRRLLEKAKAKGRKSKKGAKMTNKGHNSANQQPEEQVDEQGVPPDHQGHDHSTQSEDDYEEDYTAEYDGQPLSPSPQTSLGRVLNQGGDGQQPIGNMAGGL